MQGPLATRDKHCRDHVYQNTLTEGHNFPSWVSDIACKVETSRTRNTKNMTDANHFFFVYLGVGRTRQESQAGARHSLHCSRKLVEITESVFNANPRLASRLVCNLGLKQLTRASVLPQKLVEGPSPLATALQRQTQSLQKVTKKCHLPSLLCAPTASYPKV